MKLAYLTLAAAFSLLPFAPSLAAQTVWSVDASQGSDILQITIDAAADGDWILIQPGVYPSVVLDGKAVNLMGAGTAPADVVLFGEEQVPGPFGSGISVPALEVVGLPAGSNLWISNLTASGGTVGTSSTNGVFDAAVRVLDCTGRVTLEEVAAEPHDGALGFQLKDSALVSLNHATSVAIDVPLVSHSGQSGLWIDNATVSVRDSLFVARSGQASWSGPGAHGADGIHACGGARLQLANTAAFASEFTWDNTWGWQGAGLFLTEGSEAWVVGGPDSLLQGGDGFENPAGPFGGGGGYSDGGAGLRVDLGSTAHVAIDVVAAGGLDGGVGPAAPPFEVWNGAIDLLPLHLPHLSVTPTVAGPGDPLQVLWAGDLNSPIRLLALSADLVEPLPLSAANEWLWLDPAGALVLPGSGSETFWNLQAPTNPAAAWTTLWFQGFWLSPAGLYTSAPAPLLLGG